MSSGWHHLQRPRSKMALLPSIALATLAALCCVLPAPAHGADCTPGSFSCAEHCSQVLFCLSDGEQVVVDTCAVGWACDAAAHECVQGGVCTTPPDPDVFACHGYGYFPNPYACTKYHLCVKNDSTSGDVLECPEGTAYDSLSTRCSLSPQSRPCLEGPIPPCTAPGQVGAQAENPNIYYVCVRDVENNVVVPALYKCESDEIFVETKCVPGRRALPAPTSGADS